MAFLFLDAAVRKPTEPAPKPIADLDPVGFTKLEWSVIRLARNDSLSSVRQPSRLSVVAQRFFRVRTNPQLANPRLETLRRLAVINWRGASGMKPAAAEALFAAGFSVDQHDLLVRFTGAERPAATQP
ncbi:hypothetical protein SAMN06297144_0380 [Sphingomonas guangdongensis]|uniref:Uncharacterized protein n=1 Tax=Sphingomonas guangdongensis TaxID=1141890 RepID=A0A285QB04_9SPHN|nr:hypothetical protein [Sphingomonas guangdongensis]SOB79110.1 hypothetical protein SAMN06297144_0380 [Sphingomonas guangdongensis]